MKKSQFNLTLRKLIMELKISILIILFSVSSAFAGKSYSQTAKISLDMQNKTLEQVMDEIERQSEFYFIFNQKQIDVNRVVDIQADGKLITDILPVLFKGTNVNYLVFDRKIMLTTDPLEKELKALRGTRRLSISDQQQITVTGTVTDASTGEPMPGVNVVVKGTKVGVTTDATGKYSISVPDKNAILVFSFIGYKNQEIPLEGRTSLNVSLVSETVGLDEVVVIGYGTIKKSDLTGSVASVTSEQLREIPVTSVDQGLQARVAGVMVSRTTGEPGSGTIVRIRGGNSIVGGNEPLYVIDGIPISGNMDITPDIGTGELPLNPMATLNPADIESIEILKDASATAIYGARGANGVVLITTRRGQAGKTMVDMETYYGFQQVIKTVDMMNGQQFAEAVNYAEALTTPPGPPLFDGNTLPTPEQIGKGTDWQKEIFRTAPMQNYQLSIRGGNDITQYNLSGNYYNQLGIIHGSNFRRGSVRVNIDQKVAKWLNAGTNLTVTRSLSNKSFTEGDAGSIVYAALHISPTLPVTDESGNYYDSDAQVPGFSRFGNPVASAKEIFDEIVTDRILGSTNFDFNIMEGLTFRVAAGLDLSDVNRESYFPKTTLEGKNSNGRANIGVNRNFSWLNENYLTFDRQLGASHRVKAMAGFSQHGGQWSYHDIFSRDFSTDFFLANNIGAGNEPGIPNSRKGDWSFMSWLGRMNYTFQKKLLLTVTARADGSSKFGEGNKWGFFPSFAVGYRLSKEKFIQKLGFISNFKLRASYGVTGNSEIGSYKSLALLGIRYYPFDDNVVVGFGPRQLGNSNLKWETTTQSNIGMDLGFVNDRITFTTDAYMKKTKDLLINVAIPYTSGYTSSIQNLGELENKGIEFSLTADILTGDFKWELSGNLSLNRNKVISLGGLDKFPSISNYLYGHRKINPSMVKVGEPLGIFWGYVTDGVFADTTEINNYVNAEGSLIQPNAHPGEIKYIDTNKDGVISPDDRTKIGDPNPDFIYGFHNKFSWKGFELDIFCNGVYGADVFNVNLIETFSMLLTTNQVAAAANYWTPENTDTDVPSPNSQSMFLQEQSTRHIENGSFFRLRSITLAYNIPAFKKMRWLRSAKIYVSGQNLLTITDYTGFDPEVNARGLDNLNMGVDYGTYPHTKSITFGVNLGF